MNGRAKLFYCLGIVFFLLLFLIWLFGTGRGLFAVIMPFLFAVSIAYILDPLVDFLESRKMPRFLGILFIYAVFFSLLFFIGFTAIPALVNELQKLGDRVPDYISRFQQFIAHLQSDYRRFDLPESIREVLDRNILEAQEAIQGLLERVTQSVLGLFSHLLTILITPVLVYYFLRDKESLKRSLVRQFPKKYRRFIVKVGAEMDRTLGAYLRGMLIICFLVGFFTYLGLLLIGVDFALILGIISGITNIIPYFGPLIGALPVVLMALLKSPSLAVKALVVLFIVQQIESQLLSPQIMGRSLGLHPLAVIFVLLAGGRLLGFWGLIIAVPLTAVLRVLFKHIVDLAADNKRPR